MSQANGCVAIAQFARIYASPLTCLVDFVDLLVFESFISPQKVTIPKDTLVAMDNEYYLKERFGIYRYSRMLLLSYLNYSTLWNSCTLKDFRRACASVYADVNVHEIVYTDAFADQTGWPEGSLRVLCQQYPSCTRRFNHAH